MGYDNKVSKIKSVGAINSIHDKNNLLFKNRLNKQYDEQNNKKQKFKESLDESRRKNVNKLNDDESKRIYEKSEFDFLGTIESNQISMQNQHIACKIACGDYTSKEEIKCLNTNDSFLLQRAIVIGRQRRNLELSLKNARNTHEAQMLIYRAKKILGNMGNGYNKAIDNSSINTIMRCALERAEKKYRENNLCGDDLQLAVNLLSVEVM